MKKVVILCIGSFSYLYAQIVIDSTNHTPLPNECFVIDYALTNNEPSPGASVTWDYSSVIPSGPRDTLGFMAINSSFQYYSYPTFSPSIVYTYITNYNPLVSNNHAEYIGFTSSGKRRKGKGLSGGTLELGGKVYYAFPIDENYLFHDSINGTVYPGGPIPPGHSYYSIHDGVYWGSGNLILPGGITYNNVILIKSTEKVRSDSSPFLNRDDTTYVWLQEGFHHPVATYYKTSLAEQIGYVISSYTGIFSDEEYISLNSLSVNVFPNPASSYIELTWKGPGFYYETVTSEGSFISGKMAYTPPEIINIESLAPGIYFINIYYNGQKLSKKIIK